MSRRGSKKSKLCWDDMEELKYLLCAIECWYVHVYYDHLNAQMRYKIDVTSNVFWSHIYRRFGGFFTNFVSLPTLSTGLE